MMRRAASLSAVWAALSVLLLALLGTRMAGLPPLGALLDPLDGLYRTARLAERMPPREISIPGLRRDVRVVWDDRRVPHIFAEDDLDAVTVLGYVVARDRLFQMDFIARAASGRLASALGAAAVPADRFLRRTGMDRGARKNLERIRREAGEEAAIIEAFCRGVNAYMDGLSRSDLPFEFRLLGYGPDRCTPMQTLRVLQYMNYDLTYATDEAAYGWLRRRLGATDYNLLYPEHPDYSIPIIPRSASAPETSTRNQTPGPSTAAVLPALWPPRLTALLEGYRAGKGSNNWAVSNERSATGHPILAGDMHLSVTLPAIWYEAHIVSPGMNAYGVTIPGAPMLVEAFTDYLGWTFTNAGTDQIDHYLLEVDESGTRYRFDGQWRPFEIVLDTIRVNGGEPVVDTLSYSHWGPAAQYAGEWVAHRWVAHDTSRTLKAVWMMNHARSHEEFEAALRFWDSPMQNILYADRDGTISIRSAGYLPIRRGGTGRGVLDGRSRDGEWTGRVAFEELPHAVTPTRGYLTSTNQEPIDSSYAQYLGHDWGDRTFRSIRIDTLLRAKERHHVGDIKRYQSDVHVVQRDFFAPLLAELDDLSEQSEQLRRMLLAWDGEAATSRVEPLVLDEFISTLEELAWDESAFDPVRVGPDGDSLVRPYPLRRPTLTRLYRLLTTTPDSPWLDIRSTKVRESAVDLLRAALDSTAVRLERSYGSHSSSWRWGHRHQIRFDHLIRALVPLGRGPVAFPGFDDTLSPAGARLTTHSASWRLVVDFSTSPPTGYGVYPGGQSGNPFSEFYDMHLPAYLRFRYYELLTPTEPSAVETTRRLRQSVFQADSG